MIFELYFPDLNDKIGKTDVVRSGTQYEGWKYIFTGYKTSKYPKPKFIWKKDGRLLRETERISVSEEGNLYIAQLSFNDAGKYSCEVQLSTLKQTRELITLQVASMFVISLSDYIIIPDISLLYFGILTTVYKYLICRKFQDV